MLPRGDLFVRRIGEDASCVMPRGGVGEGEIDSRRSSHLNVSFAPTTATNLRRLMPTRRALADDSAQTISRKLTECNVNNVADELASRSIAKPLDTAPAPPRS